MHKNRDLQKLEKSEENDLFFLAKAHRITVPISHHLSESRISFSEVQLIKAYNKQVKLNMLRLTQEVLQILDCFKTNKLACFCLKGPISAQQIFNDYTAKDSRDIDLLIEKDSLEDSIQLLQLKGYTLLFNYSSLNEKQKNSFKKSNNQLALFHQKKKILVELHWRLFANQHLFALPMKTIQSTHENISIASKQIDVFSNELLLLYLSVHGAKHQWSKLYWLLEVAVLSHNTQFDWECLLKNAIRLKVDRPFIQAMVLIHQLFDIPLASNLKDYYNKDQVIQQMVKEAKDTLLHENGQQTKKGILPYWKALRYKMKLQKGWRYKLFYFQAISINDFHLVKLPRALFFGYFWLRPFFWIWRYVVKPDK